MLVDPIPPQPQFPESIDETVDRAMSQFSLPPSLIPPLGRRAPDRRAQFLKAFRVGLSSVGSELETSRTRPSQLSVKVGCVKVAIALDAMNTEASHANGALRLSVGVGGSMQEFTEGPPLEQQLGEIVAALLSSAEIRYRASAQRHYDWCLGRRAEAERDARERHRRAKQIVADRREARADRRRQLLYSQADAWRLARDIRGLVSDVLSETQDNGRHGDVTGWARWARAEADAIDPLLNGDLEAPDGS
jgi:hypothetical protein